MLGEPSFLQKLLNHSRWAEIKKLQKFTNEEFLAGASEVDIINACILNATKFFKRPLTEKEMDKIRMTIIIEKVKLREQGKLK